MDIVERNRLEDRFQYIINMRPALNKQALFSDTTSDYVTPAEPRLKEKVTIRFRTARNNVDMVNLISGDNCIDMVKTEVDTLFDYYTCTVTMTERIFGYYFRIKVGKVVCFYNARGVAKEVQDYYNFRIIAGFRTPGWAKGAVMYQIYVDRFYNGDKNNDVLTNEYTYLDGYSERVEDWDKYPAQMGVREFYGGDLQGVLDKMDYLEDLGIDVIYFNPLFVSPSNHKYDIQDYDYIDPHIGKIVSDEGELLHDGQKENRFATKYINRVTNKKNLEASNDLFAKVVKEAHKRGMKVILDGVFNHCGSFNKWLDRERIYENQDGYEKGAFISKESPYNDYFKFNQEDCWPYNPSYDGWWGHDTLPKLNYEGSRDLTDYIMKIGRKWVSAPYNADGWRLDVAADLGHSPEFNHRFWKEFRRSVKLANPNAIIIAEHYGYSRDWLMGDEWDTVMNYDAFMEPVTWFLTGMQKHSDDYREDLLGNAESFWGAMSHHQTNFTNSSLQVAMNELSNHDHSRFLTRTNRKVGRIHTLGSQAANEGVNKAVFRAAVVMQMTWPGAPTIYYGDEAGVCGFTDPDNRRTYPWGHEDKDLIEFHKQIIKVHKLNNVLLAGSLMNLGEDYNYVAYGRFDREEQVIVAVNNNKHEIEKTIDIWRIGIIGKAKLQRIAFTDSNGFSFNTTTVPVENGKLIVKLAPESATVFKAVVSDSDRKHHVLGEGDKADDKSLKGKDDAIKSDAAKGDASKVDAKAEGKADSKADGKADAKAEGKADAKTDDKAEKSDDKSKASKKPEASKEDKVEDKSEKTDKTEGRSDKASTDKNDKTEKSDKADKVEKSDKSDKTDKDAKAEKSDKDKAEKTDARSDKADSDKTDKSLKVEKTEKTEDKSDKADKDAKADKSGDKADKSDKADSQADRKDDKKSDFSKAEKTILDSDTEKIKSEIEKGLVEEKEVHKKTPWELAEEAWGKPEDNKKGWFPFFK